MNVAVYQNYYLEEHKKDLEESFIPHSNMINDNPEFREYWLFLKFYNNKIYLNSDYTGLVSQKFREKTNIQGQDFLSFIEEDENYDVYFINPWPFIINAYAFKNVWEQGEFYHKGILNFTQQIFDSLNYDFDLMSFRNSEDTLLFCNYWVGNAYFWENFMKFSIPIYKYLSYDLSEDERMFVKKKADKVIEINYTPFIMERLFSTFINYNKMIRCKAYIYPEDKLMDLDERFKEIIFKYRNRVSVDQQTNDCLHDILRMKQEQTIGLA